MTPYSFESLYTYLSIGRKIKIKFKDESWFMKLLNLFVLVFNKRFMSHYTSTIYNTIYFPSREWLEKHPHAAAAILAHEVVHIEDRERINNKYFPGVYGIAYYFPQCLCSLSLLAFLAFVNLWWLLSLGFLLFLLPIPSPGRFYIESRGYAMTLFYRNIYYTQLGGTFDLLREIENYSKYFTGPDYYYMWPFEKSVKGTLINNFIAGEYLLPVFRDVRIWLTLQKAYKETKIADKV